MTTQIVGGVTKKLLRRMRATRRSHGNYLFRPSMEPLESRRLLATFRVNSLQDESDSGFVAGVCDTALNPEANPPVSASDICTLRAAVESANALTGHDTVIFDVPAGSVIKTEGHLDSGDRITIDGGPGRIVIEAVGEGHTYAGLALGGGNSTIRNLVILGFNSGIHISSDGNTIASNFIGVNATGTATFGNTNGIFFGRGNNNTIGGSLPEDRNVISGNVEGITMGYIAGSIATGNKIFGNYIGTTADGTAPLSNTLAGVRIGGLAKGTLIGQSEETGNLISGNHYGILIEGSSEHLIAGNLIGTDHTGASAIGNVEAILLLNASDNQIGGISPSGDEIVGNVISGSLGRVAIPPLPTIFGMGVNITGANSRDNVVQGNKIGTNKNGTAAIANRGDGVSLIQARNNVIGGLVPETRNIISGNRGDGIFMIGAEGAATSDNVVIGNYIGTDILGTAAIRNGARGVHIDGQSTGNIVGGTTAAERNIISGNQSDGVILATSSATGNRILGNYIGTTVSGTASLGNQRNGVAIFGAPENEIGGNSTNEGNVISGNQQAGVLIRGDANRNVVLGNRIGTNADGTEIDPDHVPNSGDELGNFTAGVLIDGAPDNRIGVPLAPQGLAAGNVISGNDIGIFIGGGATGTLVGANIIGLDKTGLLALGNASAGVSIFESSHNMIGGAASDGTPVPGNVISANEIGVEITSATATENEVSLNRIGTDHRGAPIADPPLGNRTAGILISDAKNNLIGQRLAANEPCSPNLSKTPSNIIAGNLGAGVRIEGDNANSNVVRCNSIYANAKLGIDLGEEGVTTSDPLDVDTGANKLQNFPVLSVIEASVTGTIVVGSLTGISGESYTIDFYSTEPSSTNLLEGAYQGDNYLGTHVVTVGPTGFVHFRTPQGTLAAFPEGHAVTATATDAMGNSSEFSTPASDFFVGSQEVRIPVLFVPGFFASFPKAAPLGGRDTEYINYLTHLGIHPTKLFEDPILRAYDDIVKTLIDNGYVRDQDLFVATHDWRLPIAPTSSNASDWDGLIQGVSAASITDEKFEYGVDYMGYWLKRAAESWYQRYGQPLTHVHVLGHSMGGLVTRGYLQSVAYAETFTSTAAGRDLRLPMVANFTMLAVPNQGASVAFNAWQNNFAGDMSYRLVLSKMVNHAWMKFRAGNVIDGGSMHTIDPSDFPTLGNPNASPEAVRADQLRFLRQYAQGLGNLLPSYDFTLGFDGAPAFNPPDDSKNLFLEDLNHQTRFADRVARPIAMYGTNVQTPTQTVERASAEVGAPFNPVSPKVIIPFTDILGRNADHFEIWYEDRAGDTGDGTVPLESLEGLFRGDPRMEVFAFCDPSKAGCRATDIPAPGNPFQPGHVNHTSLPGNLDVQRLILNQLGHPQSDSKISTGLEVSSLLDQVTDIAGPFVIYSFVSDPLRDSYLLDGDGKRLGFGQGTGAVADIPGGVWFGAEDGIGWIFEHAVPGPLRLELVGRGEEYSVELTGLARDEVFGAAGRAFLATDEAQTIPVAKLFSLQPPNIEITSPVAGEDFIEGTTIRVLVTATDDVGVASIELLAGAQTFVDLEPPFEFDFPAPSGGQQLTLRAQAQDANGNGANSDEIVVDVLADQPPAVSITAPPDGTPVVEGSIFLIHVEATDDVQVQRVDFLINGVVVSSAMAEPFSADLQLPTDVDSVTIQAVAVDSANHQTESASVQLELWRTVTFLPNISPIRVVNAGDELIVRAADGSELLRTPATSFNGLVLNGSPGDDSVIVELPPTVTLPENPIVFHGGEGMDTFTWEGRDLNLDLTRQSVNQLSGIERITLNEPGMYSVMLNAAAVDAIAAEAGLRLDVAADSRLEIGPGWQLQGNQVIDQRFYRVLQQGSTRLLLNGPHNWQNPIDSRDVNGDGRVVPLDVLQIINEVNLRRFIDAGGRLPNAASLANFPGFFWDVDGNGFATSIDALNVINALNEIQVGEGESNRALDGAMPQYTIESSSTLRRSNQTGGTQTNRKNIPPRYSCEITAPVPTRQSATAASKNNLSNSGSSLSDELHDLVFADEELVECGLLNEP